MRRAKHRMVLALLTPAMVGLAGCGGGTAVVSGRRPAVLVRSGGRDNVPGVEITPAATPPQPVPVPPPPGSTTPPHGPHGNVVKVTTHPLTRAAGDGVLGDPNTNAFYALAPNPVKVADSGLSFEYCADYTSPASVDAVIAAARRAAATWASSTGRPNLFAVTQSSQPWAPPQYDGHSTIQWAVPKYPGAELASVAYVYSDGPTVIEADILLSAASAQTWYVNPAIQPGEWIIGLGMDVQATLTHELGHVLGLEDVYPDAASPDRRTATMYYASYDGQLGKQVLTPGDAAGAVSATH